MIRKPPLPSQAANDNANQKTGTAALQRFARLLGRQAAREHLRRHVLSRTANDNHAAPAAAPAVKHKRPPRP